MPFLALVLAALFAAVERNAVKGVCSRKLYLSMFTFFKKNPNYQEADQSVGCLQEWPRRCKWATMKHLKWADVRIYIQDMQIRSPAT